jgi:acetyl esterase/lipase
LIRADLPPTLLVAAENDHLVRLERVTTIADRLSAAGANVRLLIIPFVEHGFDGAPNGFGGQLEMRVVADFVRSVAG